MALSPFENINIRGILADFRSSSQNLINDLQSQIQKSVDKITSELNALEEKRLTSYSLRATQFTLSQATAEKIIEDDQVKKKQYEEFLKKKAQDELQQRVKSEEILENAQEQLQLERIQPKLDDHFFINQENSLKVSSSKSCTIITDQDLKKLSPIKEEKLSLFASKIIDLLSAERTLSTFISTELASPSSPNLKSMILELKMKINTKISQITPSNTQVNNVISGLIEIISIAKTKHDLLVAFCQYFILEKICDQAVLLVSNHLPAAIPLAQVCHGLENCGIIPQFLITLLGMLVFKCPILNGTNPSILSHSHLGYKMSSDGYTSIESSDSWINRMRGFISVFVSILLIKNPRFKLPYDPGFVWTLFSSILNFPKPHPWVPFLLVSILDVGSLACYLSFRDAYLKMIHVIKEQLIPLLNSSSVQFYPKSSLPRLEIIIDEILSAPSSVGLPL